mgnify:CR=1 FL=1
MSTAPEYLSGQVVLVGHGRLGKRIADALKAQGVTEVFTLCGGHISPILSAARARGRPCRAPVRANDSSGSDQSSRWATAIRLWKWAMPCSLMPLRSRSAMIRPWPR